MHAMRITLLAILALLSTVAFAQAETTASCPYDAVCTEPGDSGDIIELEIEEDLSKALRPCREACIAAFGEVRVGADYILEFDSCNTYNLVLFRLIRCRYRRV